MHSIIYSLYMWLRLCIILVVFRTGLKVNVMRITLQKDFKLTRPNLYFSGSFLAQVEDEISG